MVRPRFMLFAYDGYYPLGGSAEVVGSYPSPEDAVAAATHSRRDYWEVLDLNTGLWYETPGALLAIYDA